MAPSDRRIHIDHRPHLVVNREYTALLEEAGLADFAALYHFSGGTPVKRIRERRVDRVTIGPANSGITGYLKRHEAVAPAAGEWLSARLNGVSWPPGMLEFDNIRDFRKHGIPTVTPIAAGMRRTGFRRYESFLLTESVAPFLSLEDVIRHHPERLEGSRGRQCKQRLLKAVARLARKMHAEGFNHRDFNATHVLIGPEGKAGRPALALFDLQRVDRKKWLRLKWAVKLMAELHYTLPDPLFDEADRVGLFTHYQGIETMGWRHRFQWVWIKAKTRRIGRHTEKLMERRRTSPPDSDARAEKR